MKKLLVVFLLLMAAQAGYAQSVIKAGTVSLGGGIGYGQYHIESTDNLGFIRTEDQHSFSAGPSVGYLVTDNLAIGLSIEYSTTANSSTYQYPTSSSSGNYHSRQLNVGAFARYYYMVTEQFGVTGTFQTSYGRFQGDSHSNENRDNAGIPYAYSRNSTGHDLAATLIPSLVFFPIPKFGVGASLGNVGYSYSKSSGTRFSTSPDANLYPSDESGKSPGFGANFGLSSLYLSGTCYFGR